MPVFLDGVALFASFFACVVCIMLLFAYTNTLGALLRVIAHAIDVDLPVIGHAFHFISAGILALDSLMNAALVQAVDGTKWAFARMLNYTALLIEKTFGALVDLAEATAGAIDFTVRKVIPGAIALALGPIFATLFDFRHQIAYLWRVSGHLAKSVAEAPAQAVTHVITKTVTITRVEVEKQTKTVVQAVAGTLPRVGSIERTLHGIDETLKDTLKKVSPAALAGVFIGSVLSLTGLSWLRCGNVGRAGKALCGMDANALEGLLAGLIAIFGTFGLVEFAQELQPITKDSVDAVRHFWRADVKGTSKSRGIGQSGF